jgi:hypothetical protein
MTSRIRFEQGANVPKAFGLEVGERCIATRFHRAAGVAWILARATRLPAAEAEPRFPRIPIDQSPSDSKGIRDATH